MKNLRSPWSATLALGALLVVGLAGSPPAAADFDTAMSQFKAGKYLEAAKEFQAIVDASPDWADGYFMLGICFMKTSKLADAEKNFSKAIELNGDVFRFHYNLANAYQMRQQWGKVVSTLNKAERLANAQEKPLLYKLRGFSLAAQKKWGEAIDDLEKAKSAKADSPTLTQLGKAYYSVGENEKAVSNLRAALEKDPSNAESHRLMAESLLQMAARSTSDSSKKKNYADAMKSAQSYVRAKPSSSTARYLLGRAALGAGEYRTAVDEFSKVLEQKPDNCNAMANMGKAFMALNDWNNALASLDNATACSPGMGVAWENKGFALQKQKRYDAAVTAYTKALQIRPDSVAAKKGIEICQQNQGVLAHNAEMADLERQQAEEIARAQAEYEREQQKAADWKKRDDD